MWINSSDQELRDASSSPPGIAQLKCLNSVSLNSRTLHPRFSSIFQRDGVQGIMRLNDFLLGLAHEWEVTGR
jgi:hypothetical protein